MICSPFNCTVFVFLVFKAESVSTNNLASAGFETGGSEGQISRRYVGPEVS